MKIKIDNNVWMVVGSLGAITLGCLLIPLRGHVSAANLAFLFLAFTIIIAELGGRGAAFLTALISACSLNFFLTEPYLTLNISNRDDIIAFFAMAICGLIAAAFGKRRRRYGAVVARNSNELNFLKLLVQQLEKDPSALSAMQNIRHVFRLGGVALRGLNGELLAEDPKGNGRPSPKLTLTPETLSPTDETAYRLGAKGFRLPEGGGRLEISENKYSLDLWEGDPEGLTLDERRTLSIAAVILGHDLANRKTNVH